MPSPAVAARAPFSFVLSVLAAGLLATYVALMISTILFAALKTQLAQEVRDTHAEIGRLEAAYYDAIARANGADPYALGFVEPEEVRYVAASRAAGVTFAR